MRKKEYLKHKKSDKWRTLNSLFEEKAEVQKESYYKNMVEDLRVSNPGQWYSKLKRMSASDPTKDDKVIVQQLIGVNSQDQAEQIANQFAHISNLYQPLKSDA